MKMMEWKPWNGKWVYLILPHHRQLSFAIYVQDLIKIGQHCTPTKTVTMEFEVLLLQNKVQYFYLLHQWVISTENILQFVLHFLCQIGMESVLGSDFILCLPLFGFKVVSDLIIVAFSVSCQFNCVKLDFGHYHWISFFVILAEMTLIEGKE